MTRQEFLCSKVEAIVNGKIIPMLNQRENKDQNNIDKLNMAGFLYSVSRLDPLAYLMTAARQLTFEQNSAILWVKFKALIKPTLDKMVSGAGLSGYELTKEATKEKAKLVAKVRLYAIEAVEDFDITIELADDTTAVIE